jgi:hypothetical protein
VVTSRFSTMQFSQSPPPGTRAAKRPNGGTTVAAGVLAVLIGAFHLFGFIAYIVREQDSSFRAAVIGLGLNGAAGCCLLAGGILLFARRNVGRTLVLVGAAVGLLIYVLGLVNAAGAASGSPLSGGGDVIVIAALMVGLPAAATIVLALLPATARWLDGPAVTPPDPDSRRYPGRQW